MLRKYLDMFLIVVCALFQVHTKQSEDEFDVQVKLSTHDHCGEKVREETCQRHIEVVRGSRFTNFCCGKRR